MIYVLGLEHHTKKGAYYKVGWTESNLKDRMVELQCGNPYVLVLVRVYPGTQQLERDFHDTHQSKCVRGEWYRMPIHAILGWLDRCSQLQKYQPARRSQLKKYQPRRITP